MLSRIRVHYNDSSSSTNQCIGYKKVVLGVSTNMFNVNILKYMFIVRWELAWVNIVYIKVGE